MSMIISARRIARKAVKRLRRIARRGSVPTASEGPGFADLVDARLEWMREHLPPESAEYLYDVHAKDKQKALARRLGLSVAEEHLPRATLDEALEFVRTSPLEAMVLKPLHGSSGAGVYALVREGDAFRNLRNGRRMTLGSLRAYAYEDYGRKGRADEWQVEELLLPPDGELRQVEDVKFYCFAGRVHLILQKGVLDKGRKAVPVIRWYDRAWEPVEPGDWGLKTSEELRPPRSAARLVEDAERVCAQIPLPFMRLDLYDTSRGTVLGEFTPGPGGLRRFFPEWQQRFFELYREAEGVVERRLETGELQPLLPPDGARAQVSPTERIMSGS